MCLLFFYIFSSLSFEDVHVPNYVWTQFWNQLAYDSKGSCSSTVKADAIAYAYYSGVCKVGHAVALNGPGGSQLLPWTNDWRLKPGSCDVAGEIDEDKVNRNEGLSPTTEMHMDDIIFNGNDITMPQIKGSFILDHGSDLYSKMKVMVIYNPTPSQNDDENYMNNSCDFTSGTSTILYESELSLSKGNVTATGGFANLNLQASTLGSKDILIFDGIDLNFTVPSGYDMNNIEVVFWGDAGFDVLVDDNTNNARMAQTGEKKHNSHSEEVKILSDKSLEHFIINKPNDIGICKISIYGMDGKLLKQYEDSSSGNNAELNLSGIQSTMVIVEVVSKAGVSKQKITIPKN